LNARSQAATAVNHVTYESRHQVRAVRPVGVPRQRWSGAGPDRTAPSPHGHAVRPRSGKAWLLTLAVDLSCLLLPALWVSQYRHAVAVMAVLSVLLFAEGELYRPRLHLSLLDELPVLLGRLLVAAAVVACVTALRHDPEAAEEGLLRGSLVGMGLALAGRTFTCFVIRTARRRRRYGYRTVIVGGGPVAANLARLLRQHRQYGLDVVGFVDDNGPDVPARGSARWLGGLDGIEDVLHWTAAHILLIADVDSTDEELTEVVRRPAAAACELLVVPRLCDFRTQQDAPDHIGAISVVRVRNPSLNGPGWLAKRVFDVVLSSIALVALGPVMLACAVAVRLEGGPGVFFRQQRVGRDGELFWLLKFRSMRPADDAEAATRWSIAQDNRVGPVGRVLRRTSLDELPQLWNILRGDMTLVGPRPERPHFVERFSAEHRGYDRRHRVQTGLTGLAQVSGLRGDTPISDRARYDNYYIENWSLWLDVKVLLRTIREVFLVGGR
jgi:exopolysaccharide biosynthesis polyprenyl glycosylphosphotransferase